MSPQKDIQDQEGQEGVGYNPAGGQDLGHHQAQPHHMVREFHKLVTILLDCGTCFYSNIP